MRQAVIVLAVVVAVLVVSILVVVTLGEPAHGGGGIR